MSWKNIVGQKRVKEILHVELERGRLAHAYLFSGPQGCGKDAVAIELARVVNCERGRSEACGSCSSCSKMERLQHPNVNLVFALPVGKNEKYGDSPIARLSDDDIDLLQHEIQEKAASPYHKISLPRANNIKINSIRGIRKEASLAVFEHGIKTFILTEAENLSEESSNALLKTLEEPHEDTLLILTTSQPERLLPTIVSRCQHLKFDLLTAEEISEALRGRGDIEPSRADLIAQVARGSYARALDLAGTGVEEYYSVVTQFLRAALYKSRQDLLLETERIAGEFDRPDVEEFLVLLQSWFHTAMLLTERGAGMPTVCEIDAIQKFVNHHGALDYSGLLEISERAISLLNKNVYIPLILMNLALQLKEEIVSSDTHRR